MVNARFKAMVHYIIDKCDDPKRLGAIRLNKILFFMDMVAFKKLGRTITDERYVKRQLGPVPKTILATQRALEAEGLISVREREYANYRMREFFSNSDPNTNLFSEAEISIADDFIDIICNNFSANEISEHTHDMIWDAAAMGEEIPMEATLVSEQGEPTRQVLDWADKMLEEVLEEKRAEQAA